MKPAEFIALRPGDLIWWSNYSGSDPGLDPPSLIVGRDWYPGKEGRVLILRILNSEGDVYDCEWSVESHLDRAIIMSELWATAGDAAAHPVQVWP